VHEAFLVETEARPSETLKPETETEALTIQAEARPKPRPSELETIDEAEAYQLRGETEPRHYCA